MTMDAQRSPIMVEFYKQTIGRSMTCDELKVAQMWFRKGAVAAHRLGKQKKALNHGKETDNDPAAQ